MGFEDTKFKPTLPDKKATSMGKNFEKKFTQGLVRQGLPPTHLDEVDKNLHEKEQSLKKKIWDLSKMEALVHGDQKLSALYNNMAEDGEDKYGYHYNETIMNILFNEYVLDNSKYLQKYYMAQPTQKKRRDKAGIHQLQKQAKEKDPVEKARKELEKKRGLNKQEESEIYDNSVNKIDELEDNEYHEGGSEGTFNDREYLNHRIEKKYDTMNNVHEHHLETREDKINFILNNQGHLDDGAYSSEEKHLNSLPDNEIDKIYFQIEKQSGLTENQPNNNRQEKENFIIQFMNNQAGNNPILDTQTLSNFPDDYIDKVYNHIKTHGVSETTGVASSGAYVAPLGYEKKNVNEASFEEAKREAIKISSEEGVVQHVNMQSNDNYTVSDWYDSENTVASYENGRALNENESKEEKETIDNEKEDDIVDETTTSASSGAYTTKLGYKGGRDPKLDKPVWDGGKIIGESNYLTSGDGFKNFINEMENDACWKDYKMVDTKTKNEGMNSPNNDSRVPMAEDYPLPDEYYKQDVMKNVDITKVPTEFLVKVQQHLKNQPTNSANNILMQQIQRLVKGMGLGESQHVDEKSESISQQQAAGAALAAKRGKTDPSKLFGASKEMYNSMSADELEDFASTKHSGLPEKIKNEGTGEELGKIGGGIAGAALGKSPVAAKVGSAIGGNIGKQFDESIIDDQPDSMAKTMKDVPMGGMAASSIGGIGEQQKEVKVTNDNQLKDFGVSKYGAGNKYGEGTDIKNSGEVIEPKKMNQMSEDVSQRTKCDSDEVRVAGKNVNERGGCMKKEKQEKTNSNVEYSTEEKKNPANIKARKERLAKEKKRREKLSGYTKDVESSEKELQKNKNDMNKLKGNKEKVAEDRKPSSLVMKDRLGKENQENFNKDVKANLGFVDTPENELTAKAQIEKVPENPYELAQKIEKEHLKNTDGNSFENVGDSTNDEGNEIPKRNITSEEEELLNLYRNGQHSWNYDAKPSERFEERMKKDMGDEIYNLRQKQMDFKSKAPMYNKDTQPTEDAAVNKVQYDKYKSGWNEKNGLKMEGVVSAKYRDEFGKNKIVNFNLNEVEEIENVDGYLKLNMDGMGNSYTTRVEENSNMRQMMDAMEFYINDGEKVGYVKKGKQALTESNNIEPINEQFDKMKKLMGYDPSKHVDTSNIKKYRGF